MAFVASFGSLSSTDSVACHHYGAPGHVKARCFKLHPELRQCPSCPRGPTTCGFGSARTTALIEVTSAFEPPNVPNLQQLQTQIGQLQAQLGSLTTGSLGLSSSTATLVTGASTAFHVRFASPLWILDYGAIDHMTGPKRIFGRGYERDGLYYFGDPSDQPSSTFASFQASILPTSISCIFFVQTLELWHARMGHVNFQYLCQLFPLLNKACKDSIFHCVTCELSKHIRTSYIPHMTRAPCAFDLIHSDVWGPSPVLAFSGHRYYVTFIDDHTRCTWVYLLRHKSDGFPIFVQFVQMVKTQFCTIVRNIRSDNGGEYISNEFRSHALSSSWYECTQVLLAHGCSYYCLSH
ncbi:uncharacterized protein LOC114294675 [Camellia sinensis]|uniref:uncharacterized protein LOC114294675 n=1 Tax=Camellia sinensis TaxID=4442 RepID=UPI001035C823|nr:uncharacterized protein LOC114294675 [Camellia sinensis]